MTKAVVPVEQRTVEFYEDEVMAVLVEVGGRQQVYVPVRPICEALGLVWSGQFERLQRHPVLLDETICVRVTRTQDDQAREMIALSLDYLNDWLLGVN